MNIRVLENLRRGLVCAGIVLWPVMSFAWIVDGVPVCSAPDRQDTPEMTPDGAGGAFYTWIDARGGEFDIYCQRISADGQPLWLENGVAVCTRTNTQTLPQILAPGSGGQVLVAWDDARDQSQNDVYTALVDPDGDLVPTFLVDQAAWYADGAVTVRWQTRSPEISSETFSDPPEAFCVQRCSDGQSRWLTCPGSPAVDGAIYTFVDETIQPGAGYRYRVAWAATGDEVVLFETAAVRVPAVSTVSLTCAPNPFNPCTTIHFTLDRPQVVSLAVHDLSGRCLAQLCAAEFATGRHSLSWNGRNAAGGEVASGTYVLRLTTDLQVLTRKVALVR